jgi:hypothetical protein
MTERLKNGQWAPGASGNPSGRPRILKDVIDLAREHTGEAVENLVMIMRSEKAPAQARVAACNSLLDRGYGKPMQAVDVNSQINLGGISNADIESILAALDAAGENEPTEPLN